MPKGVSFDLAKRVVLKIFVLVTVTRIEDVRVPLGIRLHRLDGDRLGQWSISVNDQWRICFVWRDNAAFDVEFVDYH